MFFSITENFLTFYESLYEKIFLLKSGIHQLQSRNIRHAKYPASSRNQKPAYDDIYCVTESRPSSQ